MRVVIIADDLTGALDSAVAFAALGMRTICARTVSSFRVALGMGAEVVAVSTGSRELEAEEAVARMAAVRSMLDADPATRQAIVFNKIDSRLKGHVAAGIAALRTPAQDVVVCPAIPRLGRLVVEGDVTGEGVVHPIPVAGIVGDPSYQILDAQRDSDIDAGLAEAPHGALLVGAAGLAEALARGLRPGRRPAPAPDLHAPALIAIGSRDPVTLAQLEGLDTVPAPNGVVPVPTVTQEPCTIVQLMPGPTRIASHAVSQAFADGIATWVEATSPATLVVSGGETAAAIMQRLGIGLLDIEGEALPGLPVSRALDGRPGLTIVSKSGGFGAADTLVNLVGKLVKSP